MKICRVVISSLLFSLTTSFLMGSEERQVLKGYLTFTLDNDKRIIACSKYEMDYKIKSEDFYDKKITNLGLLNEHDKNAVERGFIESIENKREVKVSYSLDNKGFVAKITAQKMQDKKHMFFVKVKEE